jgi:hypothetical protein
VVASILGFLVHKKYTLTLLGDKNFFSLIRSNGVSKNPSFHTDFKNVHMTLVKSAPKKSFGQKTVLPIENLSYVLKKSVFWLKLFLGALFTKVICTFLKSVQKDGFFDAHSTYSKKKNFQPLEGTLNFFES